MSKETFALSTIPSPALEEESDYDAIRAAVMESARGRWFLEQHARRNRDADTKRLLAAIERIESFIRGDRNQQAYHALRAELLEMARAIAESRAEVVGKAQARALSQSAEHERHLPPPPATAGAVSSDASDKPGELQRDRDPLTALKAMTDEERIALFT